MLGHTLFVEDSGSILRHFVASKHRKSKKGLKQAAITTRRAPPARHKSSHGPASLHVRAPHSEHEKPACRMTHGRTEWFALSKANRPAIGPMAAPDVHLGLSFLVVNGEGGPSYGHAI